MTAEYDGVDRVEEQWAVVRPDLDVGPIRVIGRIHRLAHLLDGRLRPVIAAAGLGDGDFDVLASLRRADRPLNPGEISGSLMVTTGAVTKRVDRLLDRRLVERVVAPYDARSRLVSLTDAGRRTVDEVYPLHLANEERLLAPLGAAEREQLVTLLRRLLVTLE